MKLTVTRRLIFTGVVAVTMVLAAGGLGVYGMSEEKRSLDDIGSNWLPSIILVKQMNTVKSDFAIQYMKHVLAATPEDKQAASQNLNKAYAEFKRLEEEYTKIAFTDTEKQLLVTLDQYITAYHSGGDKVIEASNNERNDEAKEHLKDMAGTRNKIDETLTTLVDFNEKSSKDAYDKAIQTYNISFAVIVGAIFAAMVLVAGFVFSLLRHIGSNLKELGECFVNLANLDMRRAAHIKSDDEFGDILRQYNETVNKLKQVVSTTKDSSDAVSTASNELSSTMDTVAASTEEQSAALTEIATAVEETSASAVSVMKRTNESVEMTKQVNHELESASSSLKELQEAAQGIEEARNVIQNISEQINLLALNAAIEAARAGDAGRGFAVVADEVRKLANSAGDSTQQITERITKLLEAVEQTTAGLSRSSTMMQTVKSNADTMIGSVNEQTAAIEQISRSVHEFRSQMEDVTRSIHESKVASSSLSSTATELSSTASQFRT